MDMIPVDVFLERIKKRVGQGYIWSNYFKSKTTEAVIEATRKKALGFSGSNPFKNDGNSGRTYANKCRRWIGKYAGDCSGMIKAAWWEDPLGNIIYKYKGYPDTNEAGMIRDAKVKGSIANIPEKPGLGVQFPGHIGVYIGNGKVIEARGVNYGVVVTDIKDRPWQNYLEIPFVDYSTYSGRDSDIMLKQGDKGQAVYDYQTVCKEAGYDVGDWANMKDSNIKDGRDGSFGPYMKDLTESIQKEFNLKIVGYVNAETYGKIANKAISAAANKVVEPRVLKVGDKVIVNGKGYSASDKSGSRTNRLYSNQAMKINKIEKSAKAPYHLEINGVDIGWFEESQIK